LGILVVKVSRYLLREKEGLEHVHAPEFIIRNESAQCGMESNGQTSETIMTNMTKVYIIHSAPA